MDDSHSRTFSDLINLFKSWIPWRSEPAHVSRDFWMPDQSCRVCYECDSQFTLFNRRHHCRLCGRIFCSKCTPNWVPTEPDDPKTPIELWDKIRVCNYCFKQWEQGLAAPPVDSRPHAASLDNVSSSSSSTSANSFLSTRSSGTGESSSVTYASLPQSIGVSPFQSPQMETAVERQSVGVGVATSNDCDIDVGEQNRNQHQFGFCQIRSDDDDEEYEMSHLNSAASHFSEVNSYYDHVEYGDISSDYKSRSKVHPDGEAADSKIISTSPLHTSFDSQTSEEVQQLVRKSVEHDIVSDDCEAPSSMYVAEDVNLEPVDFENNGVLWLPPEPEDEEDEREALLFEDDDDAAGEWGYLCNSSSFGSGESRSRDKSNEEHKKAMKNVVDNHFRALVAQLLQVENLLTEEENDKESWLEIITALSWEAATMLKPDTSKGGQMDPGGYVKVKCLASGLRSESLVLKGVVCKKNVAHRRMTSKVEKARLLILGGALEYQRVSNALSSFDTLLQQEMDHLKMAVAKIDAHNPDILLVEKSVSRHAQEYLLAKDISLVLNIRKPLLDRIARCTGAQIIPSIDHLSSPKLGYCDMFRVERFNEEHGSAGQNGKKLVKTLMYFEGCPKPLGCTILLRGANGDELKKVKHVVQYGVFAAYHLALETSFLADEGASLPEFPLDAPITVALPDKQSNIDRTISTIPGVAIPPTEKVQNVAAEPIRSNSVPTSDLIKATIASINEYSETNNLSAYAEPHVSSSDNNCQHPFLNEYSEAKPFEADRIVAVTGDSNDFRNLKIKTVKSDCSDIDCGVNVSSMQVDGNQNVEDADAPEEEFPPSPSDHQSILVSLSSRCVWKGTVCERCHLCRIKYYGSSDKPLGRFLRDHLFDQSYVCRSCAMPAEAHVQCYIHRQGTLTISVKKLPEILLPGEKDGKIWMWHRCLRCPRTNGFPPATRRIVMSDAAWGLSFGKFLELSFSNHAAASRVASCGHSLHRDCLRFYGFGKMVACFRYASIDVHSVYLPPVQLDFNYESQEWIEREVNEVVERAELLFNEVLSAIHRLLQRKCSLGQLSNAMNIPESRRRIAGLEGMLQNEKSEFEESLQKIIGKDDKEAKKGQPLVDILELNRLRRQLVFQSYMWDHRLIYAASLDVKNPDNVEITSPEPVQKPVDDTDKILDPKNPGNSESITSDVKPEQDPDHSEQTNIPEFVKSDHGSQTDTKKSTEESDPLLSGVTVRRALSDGQSPICLSDTLDAAWTGNASSTVGLSEKLDGEGHIDSSSLSIPNKISQTHTEEPMSWLGMSFISFYRSLNKNFLSSAQKLDTLGEYDPVYISSFRESELQGGARLFLPVGVNDTVVPVFDDEPTSIISYALICQDYHVQLGDEPENRQKDSGKDSLFSIQSLESFHSLDEMMLESYKPGDESSLTGSITTRNSLPLDPLSYTKALHVRVSFSEEGHLGKVKYTVTCYYAKRFEALRKICCPSEVDYVRSLSRCKKWGAQGGKSNVFFAKTLDDRFIIKQVTKTELESFIKFAPGYFKYLSESIGGGPTCLAKILGIYQVTSKHLKGGKETKMDLLVMENLLFGRNLTRLYDLKGSSRSRYNPDSSGSNKVLLDQNLIEAMPTSPIFVGNKAKRVLERAVWNDTAFLASVDVMDYSLLVGVDEEKHELVLGIIDFMRQYTWDKHLETWVKASGILGGPKNASPTVISPKQYKRRFRKAMTTYFLSVPDQWSPPTIIPSKSQNELSEMVNSQNE